MIKYLFQALLLFSFIELSPSVGMPIEDGLGYTNAQRQLLNEEYDEQNLTTSLLPYEQGFFSRKCQPLKESFAKIEPGSPACMAISCCAIFTLTFGALMIIELIIA